MPANKQSQIAETTLTLKSFPGVKLSVTLTTEEWAELCLNEPASPIRDKLLAAVDSAADYYLHKLKFTCAETEHEPKP